MKGSDPPPHCMMGASAVDTCSVRNGETGGQILPGLPEPGSNSQPNGEEESPEPPPVPEEDDEAKFPQLQNNTSGIPDPGQRQPSEGDNDDEPAVATPFIRTSSPDSASRTAPASSHLHSQEDKVPDRLVYNMHKFSLYETASRYYIVGGDITEKRYRILNIDRNTHNSDLNIVDDKIIYSQKEMNQLLNTIDDKNKSTGGIKLRCTTWGVLGFVKFTGPYYMLLITKKSTVAMLGGHYIYQIEDTELIPLTPPKYKPDSRNLEESRFLSILNHLDLTRNFYYSYSYNITRTLQFNILKERQAFADGLPRALDDDYNVMFVWNAHLLEPATESLSDPYDWCRPIIHGFLDQAAISIYGRTIHVTLIARRSRFFAGARFLKRGANDLGYVANDVESEQIVAEAQTTSFHCPGPKLYSSPQFTSYVQHRGSIPLYWSQDNVGVAPKPPINIQMVDPFYSAAAMHFDDLFDRYGAPVYVVNLIKEAEKELREGKLLAEYTNAIDYLNQSLPKDRKIIHARWDMSRSAKSKKDVIGVLERIGDSIVHTTGFFHNGDGKLNASKTQNGVARTNCIDCLDRTNAAQFVFGKRALGYQLHALGVLIEPWVDFDTDAVNMLTHMYHDHGDTIALQYGGSQLVNTMETYRRINQWTSNSRDMIESFKRYYNNSFLDAQRQEAYNLFLGYYQFSTDQPYLWDLSTDYYLHHADPRSWSISQNRDYINWFLPWHLEGRSLQPYVEPTGDIANKPASFFDDYWLEYYRPSTLSSFPKMFPYKMNSTIKYIPIKNTQEGRYDLSPFKTRNPSSEARKWRRMPRKDVMSIENAKGEELFKLPSEDPREFTNSGDLIAREPTSQGKVKERDYDGTIVTGMDANGQLLKSKPTQLEKTRAAQWTFKKLVHESLNPSVNATEQEDYEEYIQHPQTLPLVVSSELPDISDIDAEYVSYVAGSWMTDGLAPTGTEEEISLYKELLKVGDNPLTVTEEDASKKRYKAYKKWLRGKSLFKQQPVDYNPTAAGNDILDIDVF
ncbi:hypothetical protein MKZ38_005353 [Zalerion maritima]|uniref:SAC domain-containing protein n=1 Tax=Zalerion maritima TaxID=339359 RepID=A0AAD5RXG9_9PEZI|nr:hypothetical protein MKZ38_005353 [Zalerion maritima]